MSATTSRLPGGMVVQRGPRNLSASDITRIRKLSALRNYENQILEVTDTTPNAPASTCKTHYQPINGRDVINPLPVKAIPISGKYNQVDFGTSRIRRTASAWTEYKAFQSADYVTETTLSDNNGKLLSVTKICPVCTTTNLLPKASICVTCKHG